MSYRLSARFIGLAVGTATLVMVPLGATAQEEEKMQCAQRDIILEILNSEHNETARAIGVTSEEAVLEVFVSEESGTWTVLVTDPKGLSCVLAAGQDWQPFDDEVLVATVRAALEGSEFDSTRDSEKRALAGRIAALSGRERDVLDGLLAGNPNKTIAFDLGISPRTVEIYRANLMTKMQAASLSDLVRMALIAGISD